MFRPVRCASGETGKHLQHIQRSQFHAASRKPAALRNTTHPINADSCQGSIADDSKATLAGCASSQDRGVAGIAAVFVGALLNKSVTVTLPEAPHKHATPIKQLPTDNKMMMQAA